MGAKQYFRYGEVELAHLRARDKRLGEVIDIIGPIEREVTPDLFESLMNSIVGQQISSAALKTVWGRMVAAFGQVTPEAIATCPLEELQAFGITFKKAGYMKNAAERVLDGRFDLEGLHALSDEEVCRELVAIDGVGQWTAEMLMTFSMQRPDVISYGDLAVLRGMRMVYHHRRITRELFERYRRRYSPYATVASLYLWAVAGGAIEGMRDYAPKAKAKTSRRGARDSSRGEAGLA